MKKRVKRIRSLIFPIFMLLLVVMVVSYFGIRSRWFRAPYPSMGKEIAWAVGLPEQAYNFEAVVPGKLYRSGRPDNRFIRYVQRKYGIRHMISLTGKEKVHNDASKLGINVITYDWSTRHLPRQKALRSVVDFADKHDGVLIHCAGGADRTGYAVAFYRVWRQDWEPDKAVREMEKYRHQPEKKESLHREMNEWLNAKAE